MLSKVLNSCIATLMISASLISAVSQDAKAQSSGRALTSNEREREVRIYNSANFPLYYDILYRNGKSERDLRLRKRRSRAHLLSQSATVEYDDNVCKAGIQYSSRRVYPGDNYRFIEQNYCTIKLRRF